MTTQDQGKGQQQLPQADALTLAGNRLQRLALECPHGSAIRADAIEWAAEALAARPPSGSRDLRAAALEFYNAAVADRTVRISCLSPEQRDSLAAMADRLREALAAPATLGWVVADGQGARWRMWGDSGPEWTADRDKALQFARRSDAEAFARDDEDAWLIQPVTAEAPAVVNRYRIVQDGRHVGDIEAVDARVAANKAVETYGCGVFDVSLVRGTDDSVEWEEATDGR